MKRYCVSLFESQVFMKYVALQEVRVNGDWDDPVCVIFSEILISFSKI